jgi:HEAT repeat protein
VNAIGLVVLILWIEGTAITAVVAYLIGYALYTRYASRRRAKRLSQAHAIIAEHLEDQTMPDARLEALRRLSGSEQIRVFFDMADYVGDAERHWLGELAVRLGLIASALGRTRSGRWWRRLSGARILSLVGAEPETMQALLADPNAMVRAQAAAYVARYPTTLGIDGLIAMLGDRGALCRFSAKDALMRLGSRAIPAVVTMLGDPIAPQTIPLLEVACATASHEHLPAAIAHIDDPRAEVRELVARLLRGIGGRDPTARLVTLLTDESATVREAAAEALGSLNHWPSAVRISRLLDDPVARVRLSAAAALDHLGPPGELLLRRSLARGSEAASTAARRVLDAPETVA